MTEHMGLGHGDVHIGVVSALLQTDIFCGLEFSATTVHLQLLLESSCGNFKGVKKAHASTTSEASEGQTCVLDPTPPELEQAVTHCQRGVFLAKTRKGFALETPSTMP